MKREAERQMHGFLLRACTVLANDAFPCRCFVHYIASIDSVESISLSTHARFDCRRLILLDPFSTCVFSQARKRLIVESYKRAKYKGDIFFNGRLICRISRTRVFKLIRFWNGGTRSTKACPCPVFGLFSFFPVFIPFRPVASG